jgi:hypothetical protein
MCCLLWKTRLATPAARADAAPMMRPKKSEVNIWSDQLTRDFESSTLHWSDQISV